MLLVEVGHFGGSSQRWVVTLEMEKELTELGWEQRARARAWGRGLCVRRGGAHGAGQQIYRLVWGMAHVKGKEQGSAVCKTRDSADC